MPDHEQLTVEAARGQVSSLLAPLREQHRAIRAEIERRQRDIEELRAAEREILRVLRAADPTAGKPGPKQGTPKAASNVGVSQEKLDALVEWLRTNVDGEPFYASALDARDDFDILAHQSGISKALNELQERGVIRLDSRGTGGRKIYRLLVDAR